MSQVAGGLGAWLMEELGAVLAWVGAAGAGAAALWQAHNTRQAGVSGDEAQAREDQLTEKRDTIAERDRRIDALERYVKDLESGRRERDDRIEDLEREREDQRTQLMVHGAWDYQAVTELRACEVQLPPPPPLLPPRDARPG